MTTATMTNWNDIGVLDVDMNTVTGEERMKALRELKASGSIHQYFLSPTDEQQSRLDSGQSDEDSLPASDWGPATENINWAGFPQE